MEKSFLSRKVRSWQQRLFPRVCIMLICCFALATTNTVHAQKKKPANAPKYSMSTNLPSSSYQRVGDTQIYYYQSSSSIDIIGYYNGYYYGSTYSNGGYRVALKVNSGSAQNVDCLNGSTIDGVKFIASVEAQGELARVVYTITNTNTDTVTISIGTHADVMIGSNDAAPITRRIDTMGNTYGLTMADGNGAQLCALFGAGLKGVTSVDDFWFGYYYLNYEAYNMVGNYASGENYMQENGSYDSGMGWCWKDRTVPTGATVVFSYLMGVGDVKLEPNSSFEVTSDDLEGWNNLSRPHKLALQGNYESPAGLDGQIQYAVEASEDWITLTDMMPSGSEFTDTLVAMFDASRSTHVIRFRTVDKVGNASILPSIEYPDVSFQEVSGIEEKTFSGDSLFQTNLTCDLDTFTTAFYSNNINVGTASFSVEGVFPYTIGRKHYSFKINPAPLTGEITLPVNSYIYNGRAFSPDWTFEESASTTLRKDTDYVVRYDNNLLPGTGILCVSGINNYTDSLKATFYIDKAQLVDSLFALTLPDGDISYDEQPHAATIITDNGVGEVTFSYTNHGEITPLPSEPSEEGSYDVYMEIADGQFFYGRANTFIGSFSIYRFDEADWSSLTTLCTELTDNLGWSTAWDMSQGTKAVGTFKGLKVQQGHVVEIDLSGQNLQGTFPASIFSFSNLHSINLSENNLSGDLPVAVATMFAVSNSLTAGIESLNISGNSYNGNLGILAQCFPNLKKLDASNNAFEDVYPMISPTVAELNLSSQKMARVVELNLSSLTAADMATKIPSILLYNHAKQSFCTSLNLLCTAAEPQSFDMNSSPDWAMILSAGNGNLVLPYVSKQNAYHGNSGDTLNVMTMNVDYTKEGSTFRVKMLFDKGDANFIQGVDATDLQATILYAFGKYANYPFNFTAADTYIDSLITVQDVVCTANILLQPVGNSPSEAKGLLKKVPDHQVADATLSIRDGQVILYSERPVATLSLKTSDKINWSLEKYGMMQATSNNNVVAYSLGGLTLPLGECVIGTCKGNAEIFYASLSDIEANPIRVTVGEGSATNISSVSIGETDSQIYDISGKRLNSLSNGMSIVRKNGQYIKVINSNNK